MVVGLAGKGLHSPLQVQNHLPGQNLGRVFNSRSGYVNAVQLHRFDTKLPNLKLKTRAKKLLGFVQFNSLSVIHLIIVFVVAVFFRQNRANVNKT